MSLLSRIWPRRNVVTFHCEPRLFGVAAPPVPAGDILPEWYRKLAATDPEFASVRSSGFTVKRCLPFRDAMRLGWVIPLAADVRFEVSDDGLTVTDYHSMPFTMIDPHHPCQVKGHRWDSRMPLKFNIPWRVVTPPGWSALFTPLLNRDYDGFETVSGLVDTDRFAASINIPFAFDESRYGKLFVLERGTPLVQVIPIRRSRMTADIRAATPDEEHETDRHNLMVAGMEGWYRKMVRALR